MCRRHPVLQFDEFALQGEQRLVIDLAVELAFTRRVLADLDQFAEPLIVELKLQFFVETVRQFGFYALVYSHRSTFLAS